MLTKVRSTSPCQYVLIAYRVFSGYVAMSALNILQIMGTIGTTLLNGGFGLLDSGIGIGQSLFNHHLAEKSAENQYQRQLDFWHKQNDYNSPLAQRQRFQDAGMNPMSATGQMAASGTAQQLSSVPGNEYAQQGVFKLEGLAQTLEIMSRIEKLGAETGLLTSQMTTEALEQTLLGLGIDKAEVEYIITKYEAQAKGMELENLPYFYEHTRNMYSLEESYKSAQIEHETALKTLSDAQTEETKASAQKIAAETGLVLLKQETEISIANLNYAQTQKINRESEKIKWETQKSMVLAPFERRAMQLANDLHASENQKTAIEASLKQLDLDAKSNPEGQPNAWYYVDRTLETIGNILGVAVGAYLGSKTGTKTKSPGSGSGLYVPGSTNINGENFVRM